MSLSSKDIHDTAVYLVNDRLGARTGELLREIVVQRRTKELLEELHGYANSWGEGEDGGTRDTLALIESKMSSYRLAACILLAHLYAKAFHLRVDYVCDSVIVRILQNPDPELTSELKLLAASEPDPDIRKRYQEWSSAMRLGNWLSSG
jgi:hypothetical protein